MGGVFGAWALMASGIGRRTLYLYGLCGLCIILFLLGFLGLVPASHRDQGALATGSLMLVWAVFYQLTVGTGESSFPVATGPRVSKSYLLICLIFFSLLFPRRRIVHEETSNQDYSFGSKSVQYRWNRLFSPYTLHAESDSLELGELRRVFLGRKVSHDLYLSRIFPNLGVRSFLHPS